MSTSPSVMHVMTPAPKTINIDQPLALAREMMVEYNCRHLPVMEGEDLVGIISDRDIGLAIQVLKLSEEDLLVRSVFTSQPYSVPPNTPLHEVLQDMVTMHIGSALVVEDGKLIGIFTAMDACAAFAEFLRSE